MTYPQPRMWYFYTNLAVLALLGSANCSCKDPVKISNYSYDGLTGPLNWYALGKTADKIPNELCSTGTHQSPIDINTLDIPLVPGNSINLTIPDVDHAPFKNLGTTVEVEVHGIMKELSSGKEYELLQFHFHTPSEHRVNNESLAMEVHFVFQAAGITVLSQYVKQNHIMFYLIPF
jgi:carbonic anhydrase